MADFAAKTTDIKVGDVVSVICIRQFGGTERIAALVKVVTPGALGVKAVRGDFDNGGGHDLKWLQKSERGKSWQ